MKKTIFGLIIIVIIPCVILGFYLSRSRIHNQVAQSVSRHILTHPTVQKSINEGVSKYIISHPQVIEQSIVNLQAQKQQEEIVKGQKLVRDYGVDLMNDKDGTPILGNPNGSIKMVVFMDPFCGYCRRFHQVLDKALEENKNLKVIVREIPIISDKSEMVIRAMLAAKLQGKYPEFEKILYKSDPSITEPEILALAKGVNADSQRLAQDMQRPELKNVMERNMKLAQQIHLTGTPTYIINGQIHAGAISYSELLKLLNKDRPVPPA
jgi:protein-disulfide isomerase